MQLSRVVSSVCALVAAVCAGCDSGADQSGNESGATACSIIQTGTWRNQSFSDQTGVFHVEVSASPSANNVDAVIGLSAGPASTWANLAAIVRFNPQGYIDARNGNTYAAAESVPYYAGQVYWFKIDIDVVHHLYSVTAELYNEGSSPGTGYGGYTIARNFAFRTEQSGVTHLNNVATYLNPETGPAGGTLQQCGFLATAGATTDDGCVVANAGGTFTNAAFPPATGGLLIQGTATPSQVPIDAVFGVGSGNIVAYNSFAASLRFYTNGMIEARDGDTYRADVAVPYHAGTQYVFTFLIDLPSKTYSVVVFSYQEDWEGPIELAHGYKFRPQQLGVTSLDHVATVVASSTGRIDACRIVNSAPPTLQSVRDGTYRVLPLPDNGALISAGTMTTRLDANTAVVGTMPSGGALAVDASGNFYMARLAGDTLVVDSYTSARAKRWSVSQPANGLNGQGTVDQMVVTSNGELLLEVGGPTPAYLAWLGLDGRIRRSINLPTGTGAVGLGKTAYATVVGVTNGNAFDLYDASGRFVWRRTVNGNFYVTALAVADDRGIALAGNVEGSVDFGDGPISPYYDGGGEVYWTTYMASLDPAGNTRFSRFIEGDSIRGVATNGQRIVVSNLTWTQLRWMQLRVWDTAGRLLEQHGSNLSDGFFGGNGDMGTVAISNAGRTWANMFPVLYGPWYGAGVPLLIALNP